MQIALVIALYLLVNPLLPLGCSGVKATTTMSLISAHNSPMISIPKKTTEEVDWTTPIRNAIAHSYGEDPENYAQECANLQRCRQDAVKGAGSDMTGKCLQ